MLINLNFRKGSDTKKMQRFSHSETTVDHADVLIYVGVYYCVRVSVLVYTDLIWAVLNECNLFFLHFLLGLSLENMIRADEMNNKS